MTAKERIAYLRGLLEGADFYGKDSQAKMVWEALLAICDGLSAEVEKLRADHAEMHEYVEAIDVDLSDLEEEVYDEVDDEDEGMVEMECPGCKEQVVFEEDFLYDSDVEVSCPACGAVVYATGSEVDEDTEDLAMPVEPAES